jgi:prophage antirepressor-like protein
VANLSVFNFESSEVRVVVVNEEPWFVGKDVASILGYTNTSQSIRQHCDDEDTLSDIELTKKLQELTQSSFDVIQRAIYINESAMYCLIFGSTKPEAKVFKRWVTSEVLPSIRKTGSYSVEPQQPQLPQTYLEALKALVASEEEKLLLQSQNQQLQSKIQENAPLVAYAEAVRFSDDSVDFNTYAKMINTGRTRLFRQMRECGVIMKNSTLPYQRFVDAGYFEVSQEIDSENGKLIPFALVTGKGQVWLKQRLDEFQRIEQGVLKSFAQLAVF